MRPIHLMTVLAASLALAGAAHAAGAIPLAAAPPAAPDDAPLPPIAEDQAQADAMTAQLSALDDRIGADEARFSVLRDAELTQENTRIRQIRPALRFGRDAYTPR